MNRTLPLVLCLGVSCGGTGATRVTFPVDVARAEEALVTNSGWTVTLTSARAHLEGVRFFSGEALQVRRPRWLAALAPIAWAHPGHYVEGEARGELLTPLEVDLLAEAPTPWGEAEGLTGHVGSQQLTYGARGLEVAGVAEKDGATVAFSAHFTPEKPIAGSAFTHELTTAPGTAQLRVRFSRVFARVDFALVGSGAEPLDESSPAFNGYVRGVDDSGAYFTNWKEAER